MTDNSVLIVGASRGIGAELVRQYLADGWQVHATVRDVSSPGELDGFDEGLAFHELDVRDRDQTTALADALRDASLDVVVHNAGIYRGHSRDELMEVNAAAPIAVVEALLRANAVGPDAKIALMTSQVGARRGRGTSLGDYGDSKAALNDEFRRRADDWRSRGTIAIVVHPGWVRTDMGGAGASIGVEESVAGIRHLIENLSITDHGRFWTWDGREHPW